MFPSIFSLPPKPPTPLSSFGTTVKECSPFTYTGVDFAATLCVRNHSGPQQKVWICFYTYCVTRAIHLDLVPSLTASAFLRSLRRFSAHRGTPLLMMSDNGKTFKSAAWETDERNRWTTREEKFFWIYTRSVHSLIFRLVSIPMNRGTGLLRVATQGLSCTFLKTFGAVYSDTTDRLWDSEDHVICARKKFVDRLFLFAISFFFFFHCHSFSTCYLLLAGRY